LLGRCSTSWAMLPSPFCISYFSDRVSCFFPPGWPQIEIFYLCLLSGWDYRHEPLHPTWSSSDSLLCLSHHSTSFWGLFSDLPVILLFHKYVKKLFCKDVKVESYDFKLFIYNVFLWFLEPRLGCHSNTELHSSYWWLGLYSAGWIWQRKGQWFVNLHMHTKSSLDNSDRLWRSPPAW
jgi:hypothetical protein